MVAVLLPWWRLKHSVETLVQFSQLKVGIRELSSLAAVQVWVSKSPDKGIQRQLQCMIWRKWRLDQQGHHRGGQDHRGGQENSLDTTWVTLMQDCTISRPWRHSSQPRDCTDVCTISRLHNASWVEISRLHNVKFVLNLGLDQLCLKLPVLCYASSSWKWNYYDSRGSCIEAVLCPYYAQVCKGFNLWPKV